MPVTHSILLHAFASHALFNVILADDQFEYCSRMFLSASVLETIEGQRAQVWLGLRVCWVVNTGIMLILCLFLVVYQIRATQG